MGDTITPVKAIKEFFESNGGRNVSMSEIKALSEGDKTELAHDAAKQLGKTLQAYTGA